MSDKVQLIKEEIEKRINISTEQGYTYSAAQLKRVIDFIDSLPEEPASEDLEEEINKYITGKNPVFENDPIPRNLFNYCIIAAAHHFAEWQEKQMLGIAAAFYEQGRFEQKQQMMKDAVEGQVVYQIGSAEIAPTDIQYIVVSDRVYIPNVKLGDKVKIIIVKEEQQ